MGDLYERDFVGWTEHQGRLLREAAARSLSPGYIPNEGPVDWEHVAEEIESLGRSQLNALASQIRRVVLHLLKVEFSPAQLPRAGWRETIADARAEVESLLENDPGLRPRLVAVVERELPRGFGLAIKALKAHGEDTAGIIARQRDGGIYTPEQILGDWLPGPPGQP